MSISNQRFTAPFSRLGAARPIALLTNCPHRPVVAPSWLWRKLRSRGVMLNTLTADMMLKHLSHDEIAEWALVSREVESVLGLDTLDLTHYVAYANNDEQTEFIRTIDNRITGNEMLCASVERKLHAPADQSQHGAGGYTIELTPNYMWVIVDKGFLYNVKLLPALKTTLVEDVLTRLLTMMPLSDIAPSGFFKNYVAGVGASA